ncbi:MAG: L-aspartate oxidase [Bacillota bacterium]
MKEPYNDEVKLGKPVMHQCDVLVIGSGIAGLYTALNIDPIYRVMIVTKTSLDAGSSSLAQGGIAACVDPADDFHSHYEDTIKAGAYYNQEKSTEIMIMEAPANIHRLLEYGTNLDKDEQGKLKVTREGGHSKRRVLHAKDATGREVIRALIQEVGKRKNIEVNENTFAIDLIIDRGQCRGMKAVDNQGKLHVFESRMTVMATGGIGQVYKNTTNPQEATGDGIAMAYRAGAKVSDMEFVQFHPTAMYTAKPGQRFLISEAVRGEGAVLRNIHGEAFMEKVHPLKDLAPRDIVARSIFSEMANTNHPCVYLDITHKAPEYIQTRFPMIYGRCLEESIDMTREWVPVAPAEHYIMGGIETDENGKTTMAGIYACGECARTGVHGANRLASNSLLEGLVFGNRGAQSINLELNEMKDQQPETRLEYKIEKCYSSIEIEEMKSRLRNIMDKYVSIIRNEEGLKQAAREIDEIKRIILHKKYSGISYYELLNMINVAALIVEAALKRKESLGAHYRDDQDRREQVAEQAGVGTSH